MKHSKGLLELIVDDLVALNSAAVDLENGLRELSDKTTPYDLGEIVALVGHINAVGFGPIQEMLREKSLKTVRSENTPPVRHEVLAEARLRAAGATHNRIGVAAALSIVRRAARYMEMYCSSTAETATRLRLTELAIYLRAWAREWIGLEVALNVAASGCDSSTAQITSRFSIPDFIRSLTPTSFAAA